MILITAVATILKTGQVDAEDSDSGVSDNDHSELALRSNENFGRRMVAKSRVKSLGVRGKGKEKEILEVEKNLEHAKKNRPTNTNGWKGKEKVETFIGSEKYPPSNSEDSLLSGSGSSLSPSVPLTSCTSSFGSPPAPLALCSHPSSFSDAEPASSRAMSPSPRSEPASDRQEFGSPAAHHRQSQKLTTERTSLKRPPRPNISEMSANSVGDDDIDLDLPERIAPPPNKRRAKAL